MSKLEGMDSTERERLWPQLVQGFKDLSQRLKIAAITFNAFGTLQSDAPPVQLSPNYPEPPAATITATDDATAFPEQPKQRSAGLVKAAKQFDALVAALPLSEGGEEAQLKTIAQLQLENDLID